MMTKVSSGSESVGMKKEGRIERRKEEKVRRDEAKKRRCDGETERMSM